jgi:formylglycine-generating enzyme required for sulfatase activity
LVAREDDVARGERAALGRLTDALVEGRLLTRGSGTLEVAHEALLRCQPIAGWLEQQKDALKLRDDIHRESKEWAEGGSHDRDLVRRGPRLEAALALQADPEFVNTLVPAQQYLASCRRLETSRNRRARRTQLSVYALMLAVIVALLGVIYKEPIEAQWFQLTTVRSYIATHFRPHVLTADEERALTPSQSFRECARACPEMVIVPAGAFQMESLGGDAGAYSTEGAIRVTIGKPFAVGKFEVTWEEWGVCVAMRGCDGRPTGDSDFGKGRRPVINVSWDQATSYVEWLSRMTGKEYRLLTDTEWEYAAHAGTQTAYSFGSELAEICRHVNLADQAFRRKGYGGEIVDCDDGQAETAPVGRYPANAFGLHDMYGNVWEWVQDCHDVEAFAIPSDGSAAPEKPDCTRVLRGGSWVNGPTLNSATRWRDGRGVRDNSYGFRVARAVSLR